LSPPTGGAVMRFRSRARRRVRPPVPRRRLVRRGRTASRTVGTLLVAALLLTACSSAPASEPGGSATGPAPAEAPSTVRTSRIRLPTSRPMRSNWASCGRRSTGPGSTRRRWKTRPRPRSPTWPSTRTRRPRDLVAQRLDSRPVVTEFEQWPQVVIDGDTATITDCVIVTQHERDEDGNAVTLSTSWEAQATSTADGWRIETAGPRDLFCVPRNSTSSCSTRTATTAQPRTRRGIHPTPITRH
jgi:hypothetical protein